MKSKLKNRVLFLGILAALLVAFAVWYKITYEMEVAQSKAIHSPNLTTKVLVATQGSDFKDAVVTNIFNFYKKDSVYIKAIDVSQLPQVDSSKYNVIVILHTWEYGKPPASVLEFIENNSERKHKMIVYATSGAGNNKIEGIDAMAGESILENASDVSDAILSKMESMIN